MTLQHVLWAVDAIEKTADGGLQARLEAPDGRAALCDLALLPADIREGDLFAVQRDNGQVTLVIEKQQTAQVKQERQQQLEALNSHSGDIVI